MFYKTFLISKCVELEFVCDQILYLRKHLGQSLKTVNFWICVSEFLTEYMYFSKIIFSFCIIEHL